VSIKLRTWPFQFEAHGLRLDGDAAFLLDIHVVEKLRGHLARLEPAGGLDQPIGQRRLAVIDVRDDAEIADEGDFGRHIGEALSRQRGDTKASSRYSLPNSVTLSMIPITWSANGT
jgi:hypothetical protein